jgi:N-acetylmuramoyl-L-alanine amidase
MKKNQIILKGFISLVIVVVGFWACSRNPYKDSNKQYHQQAKTLALITKEIPIEKWASDSIKEPAYWVGTTNFGLRKPSFVIIHHTAQDACKQTLATFTSVKSAVSAHYVICKDGTIHHMLNDYLRAYHAGVSKWGNLIDINSASIGIELDNNGFEPFDSLQIKSLISLLARLKSTYTIPTANFIGHGDIAPTRKNDPNYRFPWKTLADKGFGLWYDAVLDSIPQNFNPIQALRIIGYNVKDSNAAIQSFKRHFLQDSTKRLNHTDKVVLYNLQKKYW